MTSSRFLVADRAAPTRGGYRVDTVAGMLVTDLDHFLDLSEDTPGAARRLAEHLSHAALLGVPRTTVYGHLNRAADGAASGQVHDLGRDDRGGSAGHAPAAAVAHAE